MNYDKKLPLIKGKEFKAYIKETTKILGSKALHNELARAFNPCASSFVDPIGFKNATFLEQCKFQINDFDSFMVIYYHDECVTLGKHERNGKKCIQVTFRAKSDDLVIRNIYPAKGKAKEDYLVGLLDFIIDDMRRWHKIHHIIKESNKALEHTSRSTHYEAFAEEMEKGTLNIVERKA